MGKKKNDAAGGNPQDPKEEKSGVDMSIPVAKGGRKAKLVHQCDEAGMYIGDTEAYESPMEPGEYLMPAGTTDVPVPDPVEGKVRVFDGKKWRQEKPEVQKEAKPDAKGIVDRGAAVRAARDKMLASTDWTQLADADPKLAGKYKTYRQQLRDLPDDPKFPDVDFPTQPK